MNLRLAMLLAALCISPPSLAAVPCLHYMGNPVTLTGKVTLRTFYGPPGYGETTATDSRETQAILRLTRPICVEANPTDSDKAEQNQWEVTLVPPNNTNLKHYAGKQITVQGKLFHANTGHHHTPVLIEIIRIDKSDK